MLAGLRKILRRRRLEIGVAFTIALLFFVFLFAVKPSSPAGTYFEKTPFSERYWRIFKDGTLYLQYKQEPREQEPPQVFGTYYKSGDQWVWEMGIPPTKVVIEPSWFGVKLTSSQFIGGQQFWPRYGFCWAYDCWNWIQLQYLQ